MATFTTVSGLTVAERDLWIGGVVGLLTQFDQFNAASNNTIVLDQSRWVEGRRVTTRNFGPLENLVRRRDPTSRTSFVPTQLTDLSQTRVQVYRETAVDMSPQDFVDAGLNEAAGRQNVAFQWAQAVLLDYLQAAASCLIGSMRSFTGDAAFYNAVSGGDPLTYSTVNTALGFLGDSRSGAAAILLNGYELTQFIGQAYTDANIAFLLGSSGSGNAAIYGGMPQSLGLAMIVSDLNELFVDNTAPTVDNWYSLVLQPNAVIVSPGPVNTRLGPVMGDISGTPQTITDRMVFNSEFMLGVRGVSYTGGTNPTNADLANPSNWTPVQDDPKAGPGIAILTV